MNQKIPFHDLSARIAVATGISNESAEQFVKNFFEVLSEALIKGESIRVKGLGSFTVIETPDGKNIEFVPDKEMADTINAPFAMFEPVKLDNAVTDRMLSEIERDEQSASAFETAMDESEAPIIGAETESPSHSSENEEESNVAEPATSPSEPDNAAETAEESCEPVAEPAPAIEPEKEAVPAVEETPAPANEETPVQPKDEAPAPIKDETPATVKNDAADEEPVAPAAAAPVPLVPPVPPVAPVVTTPAPQSAAPIQNQSLNPPSIRPLEDEPEEYVSRNDKSGGGNFWTGLVIGLIVGLALGACGVYLAIDHIFPTSRQSAIEEAEIELVEEAPIAPADTLAAEATPDTVTAPAPVAAPEPAPAEPAKIQSIAETAKPEPKIIKDTVRSGYLIINMAKKYYGSKDFWVYIYEENKAKIGNPNRLQPGVELVIPPAEKYGIDANNPESVSKAKRKATEILKKYPR